MVDISDLGAWHFQYGLKRIKDSFLVSIEAMNAGETKARADQAAYLKIHPYESIGDADLPNAADVRFELQAATIEARMAAQIVREAFVTSAFHFWERSVTLWAENTKLRNFSELEKAASNLGYPPHPDLSVLNSLNNLLKHNNPDRGDEVFNRRADLFKWQRKPRNNDDWRDAIKFSDESVLEFFEIVRLSGPEPVGWSDAP